MLAKQYRLKKDKDFDSVFKKGKGFSGKYLFLKAKKNNLTISRFGFIVGKSISNKAVVRNKIKRRLREIVRENINKVEPSFDVVIVAKPEIINKKYQEIKEELEDLLKKLT